jgi:hypothetical protein
MIFGAMPMTADVYCEMCQKYVPFAEAESMICNETGARVLRCLQCAEKEELLKLGKPPNADVMDQVSSAKKTLHIQCRIESCSRRSAANDHHFPLQMTIRGIEREHHTHINETYGVLTEELYIELLAWHRADAELIVDVAPYSQQCAGRIVEFGCIIGYTPMPNAHIEFD